jgi:hypothetical protein
LRVLGILTSRMDFVGFVVVVVVAVAEVGIVVDAPYFLDRFRSVASVDPEGIDNQKQLKRKKTLLTLHHSFTRKVHTHCLDMALLRMD